MHKNVLKAKKNNAVAKYLVIVESPSKEKTISKILGNDFIVKSSYGHIRDLPKSKLGIDIENNFKPTYTNISKAKKLIADLKKQAEKSDKIYLATDFDREGEAIAWHLKEVLKLPENKILRITFNEITTESILNAVKKPRKLDMRLVNSQQTRRILDRLVGYKLSPLLWKKVKLGLSAGRVQSVAVMLICNREKEIENFVPAEYWRLEAELSEHKKNAMSFKAQLFSKNGIKYDKLSIKNREESDEISKELESAKYIVKSINTAKRKRFPHAPYVTSTMQQDASRRLGFSVAKTMYIAQKLYEGINIGSNVETGLISYMRTDSLNIAKSVQNQTLKFIETLYGSHFLPKTPRIYKTKIKGAQEAHEAIRPSLPNKTPLEMKQYLSADEFKLYELIWKRFIASQMADAIYNITTAEILAKDYLFKASGSTLLFDGFLKVHDTIEEHENEIKIPHLKSGDNLDFLQLTSQQHFTEPASHYNEASLIKALEEHGIGRPSTYAPIIKTILDRLYVRIDGKRFIPTNLGIVVNNVLKLYFGDIINIKFTADIEEKLDKITEDKVLWQSVLKDFYEPFGKNLNEAEKSLQRQKIQQKHSSEKCPKCGSHMFIKDFKKGQFLGCSRYPECKTTLSLDNNGKITQNYQETDMKCENCGNPLIKKTGFQGKQYLLCKNYKNCKTMYSVNKNGDKILKPTPEYTDIKCEKCGSKMVKRIREKRSFLTCSLFPKCRNLKWIKMTKTPKSKMTEPQR
ncbi:MAG: type I DNA topoisomerase [Endomicrobium sp.]|jgi:DNA topoisomerase-1|nr:type I DNA topoisomerase [Endomicrobium sp.]